jgi:hypothetical protein
MTTDTLAFLSKSLDRITTDLFDARTSFDNLIAIRAKKMSRKSLKKASKKLAKREKAKQTSSPLRIAKETSSHLASPELRVRQKDTSTTLYIASDNFGSGSLAAFSFKDLSSARQQLSDWDAVLLSETGFKISGEVPTIVWAVVAKSVHHGIWASCVGVYRDKSSAVEMARFINSELDSKSFQAFENGYESSDEEDYLEYFVKAVDVESDE